MEPRTIQLFTIASLAVKVKKASENAEVQRLSIISLGYGLLLLNGGIVSSLLQLTGSVMTCGRSPVGPRVNSPVVRFG